MKIAVTGEGATDYGKSGRQGWEWGAVEDYIAGIAIKNPDITYELIPIERADIKNYRLSRKVHNRELKGLSACALIFCHLAHQKNCSHGIYYSDADKSAGERNTAASAKKRFKEVYEEINNGLSEGFIPMVPLRMLVSWLLGDKEAVEEAMGIRIDDKKFPSHPENLWGKDSDPKSNHPKMYLRRLIRESGKRYSRFELSADVSKDIAGKASTDTMKSSCPISYTKFYEDLVGMFELIKERELQ